MRQTIVLIAMLAFAGCAAHGSLDLSKGRLIDLTHSFDADAVYWPTAEPFKLEIVSKGQTPGGYHYEANQFSAAEHGGTHIDAPIHFWKGGDSVDQITLETLTGPAVCVDVRSACAADRDHLISIADFQAWEAGHGRIPDGTIVLMNTGFGARWPDRDKYMGTAERGPDAVAKLHFPGLDPKAADWLITQRHVKIVGLDTPSIDYGQSKTFDSHVRLFSSGVPALENVANLDQLPARGFGLIALPMKIAGGSGGPTRIVAVVSQD